MKPAVRTVPREEWGHLLERFRDRTVYHTLPWLDILCALQRGRLLLTAVETEGKTAAIWPALEVRKGPLRILGSPLPGSSTTYLGPLFRPEVDPSDCIAAFLADPLFHRHAYFSCRVVDRSREIDLAPFGFRRVRKFPTYWLDLTRGEEALWARLRSECRSRVRRAHRLGAEVRFETTPDFIEDFWKMSLETFARSGARPTHDERFVRELWKQLAPAGRVIALSAFREGERLATLVLPTDGRVLYYWGGASFDRHRSIPSNNLLHWAAIVEAIQRGHIGYDLISSSGGPGRFKRSFAPEEIDMATYWERSSSPWLALVKNVYEKYRRRRLGIPDRQLEGDAA